MRKLKLKIERITILLLKRDEDFKKVPYHQLLTDFREAKNV